MVFEKVAEVIAEYKGVETSEITKETSFVDDLKLDSLDTVELIMTIESEFDVTVEVSENMKTVGDLVKLIEAQK